MEIKERSLYEKSGDQHHNEEYKPISIDVLLKKATELINIGTIFQTYAFEKLNAQVLAQDTTFNFNNIQQNNAILIIKDKERCINILKNDLDIANQTIQDLNLAQQDLVEECDNMRVIFEQLRECDIKHETVDLVLEESKQECDKLIAECSLMRELFASREAIFAQKLKDHDTTIQHLKATHLEHIDLLVKKFSQRIDSDEKTIHMLELRLQEHRLSKPVEGRDREKYIYADEQKVCRFG